MSHILLVDDDDQMVDGWAQALRKAGHTVALATNGADGLHIACAQPCDLIVSEFLLHDQTVIDFLREMHCVGLATPVLVVTRVSAVETVVDAMRHGAFDYVVKPLRGDDLVRRVQLALTHVTANDKNGLEPYRHSAARWAAAVVRLLDAPADARTIDQWARAIAVSGGALKTWCRIAKLSPRRSLILARLLRVVHHSGTAWRPEQLLEVRDPRTLHRMLEQGGLTATAEGVTMFDLLHRQTLIRDADAIAALRAALDRHPVHEAMPSPSIHTDGRRAPTVGQNPA